MRESEKEPPGRNPFFWVDSPADPNSPLAEDVAVVRRMLELEPGREEFRLTAFPFKRQPGDVGMRCRSRAEQTGQRMTDLEDSVAALEKSVNTLAAQLARLTSATEPASVQQLADKTGDALMRRACSLVLLATGCAEAIVALLALLRRWGNKPPPHEGGAP